MVEISSRLRFEHRVALPISQQIVDEMDVLSAGNHPLAAHLKTSVGIRADNSSRGDLRSCLV
jgi:hypothetical protein